jgi:lipopolysaccharide export system protein LptA
MIRPCSIIIFIFFVFSPVFSQGQQTNAGKVKTINLLHADILQFDNVSGIDAQKLIGNVKAEHDGSVLWCDSAYLYNNNSLDAFGNVRININDSLDLYGDSLFYDGNTKIAKVRNNVKLIDQKAILYTDILIYNRITDIGRYAVWGRIEDSTNILTSKRGYYHSASNMSFFKDSVVVINPDYLMKSDTLKYNTSSEDIFFLGPTTIEGDSSFLYAEKGRHSSAKKETILTINAFIQNESNILEGDSLFFSKEIGLAKAFGNVKIKDTTNNVVVYSQFAIYNKPQLFAYATDSASAVFIDKKDSVFMHADTLMLLLDSLESPEYLLAYRSMKFFSSDMQGMSDSLAFSFNDSIVRMFYKPFLWFDENQISSERIDLISRNGKLDSAFFQSNVFLVNQDTVDSQFYNQISGKDMYVWFSNDKLRKIFIEDQSESIYFLWEDDGTPIGMNKMKSEDILIFLKNQELETMTYMTEPIANLTPTYLLNPSQTRLRNFVWKMEWRPLKKEDIFNKQSLENILEETVPEKRKISVED